MSTWGILIEAAYSTLIQEIGAKHSSEKEGTSTDELQLTGSDCLNSLSNHPKCFSSRC
jgi:hypothetical protein